MSVIVKYSFEDYVRQRLEDDMLNEMPLPPTSFKNLQTGEFEGEHHVSSNAPVFTDTNDIYYLYQFPPKYWAAALNLRYNKLLYDAKVQGDKYDDIQDVTLPTQGGAAVTFHKRNTFVKALLDKIERTVDIDYLSKSGKSPEERKAFKDKFQQYGQEKKDLGGYFGATLADPVKQTIASKSRGKEKTSEMWVSKGFMPPGTQTTQTLLNKWLDGSSEGWLKDLSKVNHKVQPVSVGRGGAHTERTMPTFTGSTLQSIRQEMIRAGATPFEIVNNGNKVVWKDVTSHKKKSSEKQAIYPERGEPLPVLFAGMEVHSSDVKSHARDKQTLEKFKNLQDNDFNLLQQNLDDKARKIEEEITERDRKKTWEKNRRSSKERASLVDELNSVNSMREFKKWANEKHPGVNLDTAAAKGLADEYAQEIQKRMSQRLSGSRKYTAYDWSVHRHNRDRLQHDPLDVGMGNPTALGPRKYPNIMRGQTTGMGTIWPNRQSKTMIHGPQGQWEDKFQHYHGHGYDDASDKFKLKSLITKDDYADVSSQAAIYLKKVAEKIAADDESLQFLGLDKSESQEELIAKLSNVHSLQKILTAAQPELSIKRSAPRMIPLNAKDIPDVLRKGANEISSTEYNLSRMRKEANTGFTNTSAIATGIDSFLNNNPGLKAHPEIQTAMQAMRLDLIRGAEKFVRRNIGESPFLRRLENEAKGVKGVPKHQQLLDLNQFIKRLAVSYAVSISQLDFGTSPTRRMRASEKAYSMSQGGSDDQASSDTLLSLKDGLKRIDQRALDYLDTEGESDILKDVQQHLFANAEKSKTRAWRPASNYTSGSIGHSVETMYKLLADAQNKATAKGVASFSAQTGSEASSDDSKMISNISGAVALYYLFMAAYERKMTRQGQPVNKKEGQSWARKKVLDHLAKKKLISPDAMNPETDVQAIGKSFKQRVDDAGELDRDEEQAAKIISGWEDDDSLNQNEINLKLNDMEQLNKANIHDTRKRVTDLVLMYYGRQPIMGSFTSLAASETGALPDVRMSLDKLRKIKAATRKLQQANAQTPPVVAPAAQMQPKPAMPIAPVKPAQAIMPPKMPTTTSPLGKFRRSQ